MNNNNFIPISRPALIGNELTYVTDCVKTGWISSLGDYVQCFLVARTVWWMLERGVNPGRLRETMTFRLIYQAADDHSQR
jgi:hypothetical protein